MGIILIPPKNCLKAFNQLKSRVASDEYLIEVYVRKSLNLLLKRKMVNGEDDNRKVSSFQRYKDTKQRLWKHLSRHILKIEKEVLPGFRLLVFDLAGSLYLKNGAKL